MSGSSGISREQKKQDEQNNERHLEIKLLLEKLVIVMQDVREQLELITGDRSDAN